MSTLLRDTSLVAIGAGLGISLVYVLASKYTKRLEKEYDEFVGHDGTASARGLSGEALEGDDIVREQLTRNIQFFGLDGQKCIAESFVVVVGLGGVGSHAAHMLLRAGVGKLRLVDFDQVSLSSLNRHCLATREDVGTEKAACLVKYFRKIFPEVQLESMCKMYCKETEDSILSGEPDFVLDAIDNIDTKVDLVGACHLRGIRVLSVAGAGAKADPTRLRFVDIAESCADPLARSVRARLKREYGISSGVPMLLSTERPRCGLVDAGEEGDQAQDMLQYQIVPNFRIRTIPVLGTTPAVFGMAAAGYILCELAQQRPDTEPFFRLPAKSIQTQYHRLEARLGREPGVDMAEVEVLIREIWRGESARATEPSPATKGLSKNLGNLFLTIWDPSKSDTVDNLVLLTREEADMHDEQMSKPGGFADLCQTEVEFATRVESRLQRARVDFKYGYY